MDNLPPLGEYADLPLDDLVADPQPRETFDEQAIAELAASIKEHGQLQAARVRWDPTRGKYRLLAGERRYRACRLAGLPTLRCQVLDRELTPAEVLIEQLAENVHRRDLQPLELARGVKALMEMEGLNRKQAAARLHLHPSTVGRALALLDQPAEVQEAIANGKRAASSARKGARKRGKLPRGASMTLRTPRRWVLTVATPRRGLSDAEVAAELEAVASQLRGRAAAAAGPRLAEGTAPPAAEVA